MFSIFNSQVNFVSIFPVSGISLVSFFIPLLVAFLSESEFDATSSSIDHRLHKLALKKLIDFGPQYPADFRTVMQSRLDLRCHLERAIQSEQAAVSAAAASIVRLSAGAEPRPTPATTASIKLTMDFSNFAS